MLFRFSLYGFLKNQRYYDHFLYLVFLEKGLSYFEIGILIGFREICTNLFEIPSGALADLYGRQRAMIFSFWAAFAKHRDITYLGIDSSHDMCRKAQEINRYTLQGDKFFTKGYCVFDYNRLFQSLDDYIMRGDQTQIIFNFCYLLASNTLDIENLSNVLIQIVEKYNQHKMFVIYQNPPIPQGYSLQTSRLHKNWYFLKTQLSMFQSQITQSNTERFIYDSLVDGLPHTLPFYFDILSNEPSVVSSDPFELPSIF